MTGVSVSGLCSKDVSYRPVKMSLHPATVKMSLQPPGSVLSVLHHPSTAALQCNKLLCAKFMAEQPYEVFVVVQSVHSCPIGRMLDPKAGFTILLPPSNLLVILIALLVFIAECFLVWTILFTKRLHRVTV